MTPRIFEAPGRRVTRLAVKDRFVTMEFDLGDDRVVDICVEELGVTVRRADGTASFFPMASIFSIDFSKPDGSVPTERHMVLFEGITGPWAGISDG